MISIKTISRPRSSSASAATGGGSSFVTSADGRELAERVAAMETVVATLRQSRSLGENVLQNPAFALGLQAWNRPSLLMAAGRWIWTGLKPLSRFMGDVAVVSDVGRTAVRIRSSRIAQLRGEMNPLPDMPARADGTHYPVTFHLAVTCRCAEAGRLTAGFRNASEEGTESFTPLAADLEMKPGQGYAQVEASGLWNGTGDFTLSFTGTIFISHISLATSRPPAASPAGLRKVEDSDAVETGSGWLLGGDLCLDISHHTVLLPVSAAYEGARVTLLDSYFRKNRGQAQLPTVIKTSNGSPVLGGLLDSGGNSCSADSVTIDAGHVELMLQNLGGNTDANGVAVASPLRWVMLSCSCRTLQWTAGGTAYQRICFGDATII